MKVNDETLWFIPKTKSKLIYKNYKSSKRIIEKNFLIHYMNAKNEKEEKKWRTLKN